MPGVQRGPQLNRAGKNCCRISGGAFQTWRIGELRNNARSRWRTEAEMSVSAAFLFDNRRRTYGFGGRRRGEGSR